MIVEVAETLELHQRPDKLGRILRPRTSQPQGMDGSI
jgi:hypothetical protein